MAGDEIFIGSVAIGVVPDLRGFNDRIRAELVPGASRIGEDIGREMARGILNKLDLGDVIAKATVKARPAVTAAGLDIGARYGKAIRKAVQLELKDPVDVKISITDASLARMRAKIKSVLSDAFTIKVKADIDNASLLRLAAASKLAAAASGGGGGGRDINKALDDLVKLLGSGGGRGGGPLAGGARGGGGFFGQAGALFRALPGGATGNVGAVTPQAAAIGTGVVAAVAPFIGQALGGLLIGGLGTGLAGLGIAGALMGNVSGPAAQKAAADRLMSSQLRVAAAQEKLNTLQKSGKATAQQLMSAQAALASAQASEAAAADKAGDINARSSKSVAALQDAFSSLEPTFKRFMTTAGAAFTPVLTNIFRMADSVMNTMAPIFGQASKIIAGPFKVLVDTVLKSFTDPAVKSSITAVATAFADILKAFTPMIPGIMDSFAQSIERIADAIAKNPKAFALFLDSIAQVVIGVFNLIAYLTDAANWIEEHWIPGWKRMGLNFQQIWGMIKTFIVATLKFIRDVFKLFIDVLSGNWHAAWKDILNIGKDFAGQLKVVFLQLMPALWHFIQTWLNRIKGLFDLLWEGIVLGAKWLDRTLNNLFIEMGHEIAHDFDTIRHAVASAWDLIWNNTIGRLNRGIADSQAIVAGWMHWIASTFDNLRHDVASIWDALWNWVLQREIQAGQLILNTFTKLKTNIVNWFHDAVNWLVNAGSDIVHGLLNGIKSAMSDIGNWINNNVVQPIISHIKSFFHITSPSQVMMGIGKNITAGLLKGILSGAKDLGAFVKMVFGGWPAALGGAVEKGIIDITKLPEKALKALTSLGSKAGSLFGKAGSFFAHLFGGGGGGGVQQWAGLVAQALAMLGLPLNLGRQVLFQMQTESGGNPNAINLTDINAMRGDPSRGLLQVIGSTFAAFHVPGTSSNIYDPLANIAAAINYAMHTYGPTLMRGGMGMGSGHGYALGTGGAAPGWAWVGEAGPELVNFAGGETVIPWVGHGYQSGTLDASVTATTQALIAHDKAVGVTTAAHTAATKAHTAALRAHAAAIKAHAAQIAKMQTAGASMAAAAAKITTATTPASFAATQRLYLKELTYYFSTPVANQRSNLVMHQIASLQSLETRIKTLNANIAEANTFQQQTLAHLQAGTGLGAIGIQGQGAAQGRSLLSGLNLQVSVIRGFGNAIAALSRAGASQALLKQVAGMDPSVGTTYARTMVTVLNKLKAMHAPASIINQLVALGPDAALAYANALQAAGPKTLAQIVAAESALGAAQLGVSRGITSVVEGGKYVTGPNFIAGLKSQQAELNKVFASAGKALAEEAIRWFNVPAKQRPHGYQHGGWINEPIFGYGMNSGASYMFAEHGREYVVPEGWRDMRGGDGATYHAHFDGLTGQAIEGHVRTAFQAMSITAGALNRQGRRSLWACQPRLSR